MHIMCNWEVNAKVVDAWLVTGKDLIGSLVQVFAEVDQIGRASCRERVLRLV